MQLIRDLHAEGTTIAVITHDTDIAAELPRRVTVHDGSIIADSGHPDDAPEI
jgi:putative ABC transport system ATP-binding protein